jgi:hypothetical protein
LVYIEFILTFAAVNIFNLHKYNQYNQMNQTRLDELHTDTVRSLTDAFVKQYHSIGVKEDAIIVMAKTDEGIYEVVGAKIADQMDMLIQFVRNNPTLLEILDKAMQGEPTSVHFYRAVRKTEYEAETAQADNDLTDNNNQNNQNNYDVQRTN